MKRANVPMRFVLAAAVFTVVGLAGCAHEESTPVDQRKPGEDISKQDRADKRGDVPTPPGK